MAASQLEVQRTPGGSLPDAEPPHPTSFLTKEQRFYAEPLQMTEISQPTFLVARILDLILWAVVQSHGQVWAGTKISCFFMQLQ